MTANDDPATHPDGEPTFELSYDVDEGGDSAQLVVYSEREAGASRWISIDVDHAVAADDAV